MSDAQGALLTFERIGWASLLSLLAGCGELAGSDYRGEVLLSLAGRVLSDGTEDLEEEVGVTILWSLQLDQSAEQQAVVTHTSFPSRYTLELYHPPQASELQPLMGQEWLPAAVGQPILFEDLDRDGLWDQTRERLVGGAFDRAIVWIASIGEPREEVGGWVPESSGFHVVELLQQPCVDRSSPEIGLLPVEERQTDLEIGYYYQASFDWDCDGEDDWNPDGTSPDPFGECAEAENYLQECEAFLAALDDPGLSQEYLEELYGDPLLSQCLEEICPDTIDELVDAADCPPEEELLETCGRYEQGLGDPNLAQSFLDELSQDPELESCLWQTCPWTLEALVQLQDPSVEPTQPTDTCDAQQLQGTCDVIEESLANGEGDAWRDTLAQDPELEDCLRQVCPGLIDALLGQG